MIYYYNKTWGQTVRGSTGFLQQGEVTACVFGLKSGCRGSHWYYLALIVKLWSPVTLFNVVIWMLLASLEGPDNMRSSERGHSGSQSAGISLSLCAYAAMMMWVFPEGNIIGERGRKIECRNLSVREWEGGCSYLYIYHTCVWVCVCALLRAHLVWRSRRMYKVPFMLWSPLYLPKHQPGRYDVQNIFTLNFFQLAF